MASLPSLFVSHGAPDLVLGDHPAKHFLADLGARLPRPRAILIVSAHWEASIPTLTTGAAPETVHDFHGFPEPLYALRYPARTSVTLIEGVRAAMSGAGIEIGADPGRGYDHGGWTPLLLMYPHADVPVVQLALEHRAGARRHFEIGRALAPLRAEDVLVVGSGSSVHNLRRLGPEGSPVPVWASEFDGWLHDRLSVRDLDALLDFAVASPHSRLAHPTPEHLMPLFVAMGAGWDEGRGARLHQSYNYGSVGMGCYAFGGGEIDALAPARDTTDATGHG